MLENPEALKDMVNKTNAKSTDLESPETVEHLCAKCEPYAAEWAGEADKIWTSQKHKEHRYSNYKNKD